MTDDKKKIVIDGRTKDEIITDLKKEVVRLQREIEGIQIEHREQWDRLCPNLPDEMRKRARLVWEAALHSHETATEGQPGPVAVVASALLDAEKEGPRKLKGGQIDPVAFVADRIESIAKANGRDPMDLFASIAQRMANPDLNEAQAARFVELTKDESLLVEDDGNEEKGPEADDEQE